MRPNESFIGQSVRSLQTMLRVIGQDEGRQLTVIPDGFYGSDTQAEVSRFQRNRGLAVTGVADQATWDRIAAEYDAALVRLSPAQPIQIILNPGVVYRRGDESQYIFLVQAMLHSLAEIYGFLSAPPISGIYDEATAEAIARFQDLHDLPQTGELDKVTWKYLALQYPLAVNRIETVNRTRA